MKLNGQFKTPTGQTGSIFNLGDWISMILGGVVLIITFAMSQNIAKLIGSNVPVDTKVDRPWNEPKPVSNGNKLEVL